MAWKSGGTIWIFQSTLPQGERLQISWTALRECYFNPRSRKGSDLFDTNLRCIVSISIHAPARGATNL